MISIIIPVFNRASLIEATLKSVQAQSFEQWECLIIDDGSTDDTINVITQFIRGQDRFQLFQRPQEKIKGANACRNYGFKMSSGDFIQWFDSDDLMHPNLLEAKIKLFEKGTEAVLHRNKYANYPLTRFRDSKFNYKEGVPLFYHYGMDHIEIQTSGFMWRRSYLEDKLLFDESIQRFQDNEFHIRMLALQPHITITKEVLATIRGGSGHPTQISSQKNLSSKKLNDIFFYRYQSLILSKVLPMPLRKSFYREIHKKAIWAFYEYIGFESTLGKRIGNYWKNFGKIAFVLFHKWASPGTLFKAVFRIKYLILFGTSRKSND